MSVLFWEERGQGSPWHDEVVDQVAAALSEGGHKVSLIGISDDVRELLDKLDDQRPELVFNLCERFAGNDSYDMHVITLLEMLGQPFTGTGPLGTALRQDKVITKKLLQFHQVTYPDFITFDKHDIEFAGRMRFPLFVKPLCGDASLGIDDSSLVTEYTKLIERVGFIQTQLKLPALVEEYVEGREFYVSILGNDPGEVLPVMELDFTKLPSGYPRIYGHDAKSDESSVQYGAVNAIVATDLTPEIRARITMVGREAAYALKVRDYARVDIRLTPEGTPVVLEINANPYLERTSAFPLAALQAGMGYTTLINRIAEIALKRLEPTPFMKELQKNRAGRARMRRRTAKLVEAQEIESERESAKENTEKPDLIEEGDNTTKDGHPATTQEVPVIDKPVAQ
jgi:D-alanine-D-alanine ligase